MGFAIAICVRRCRAGIVMGVHCAVGMSVRGGSVLMNCRNSVRVAETMQRGRAIKRECGMRSQDAKRVQRDSDCGRADAKSLCEQAKHAALVTGNASAAERAAATTLRIVNNLSKFQQGKTRAPAFAERALKPTSTIGASAFN